MKVFLSWSGDYSRQIAEKFHAWIPCVLQQVDVFLSTNAIDPGDRWNDIINGALDEIDFGILFVTKDNVEKPWLLFEAGALAKNVSKSKVIPILIDARELDLSKSPLFHFQNVDMDKTGVFKVMKSIFRKIENPVINEETLLKCLNLWWPQLDKELSAVAPPKKTEKKKSVTESERIEKIEDTMSDMLGMISQIRRNTDHYDATRSLYYNNDRKSLFSSMRLSDLRNAIEGAQNLEELHEVEMYIMESANRYSSAAQKSILKEIRNKSNELRHGK